MFQIEQNPTFEASIKFKGQGREQTLAVTFKAKTRSECKKLWEGIDYTKSETAVSLLCELIEKWDASLPLGKDALTKLDDNQPGAVWHLLGAYQECLVVEREGN